MICVQYMLVRLQEWIASWLPVTFISHLYPTQVVPHLSLFLLMDMQAQPMKANFILHSGVCIAGSNSVSNWKWPVTLSDNWTDFCVLEGGLRMHFNLEGKGMCLCT